MEPLPNQHLHARTPPAVWPRWCLRALRHAVAPARSSKAAGGVERADGPAKRRAAEWTVVRNVQWTVVRNGAGAEGVGAGGRGRVGAGGLQHVGAGSDAVARAGQAHGRRAVQAGRDRPSPVTPSIAPSLAPPPPLPPVAIRPTHALTPTLLSPPSPLPIALSRVSPPSRHTRPRTGGALRLV